MLALFCGFMFGYGVLSFMNVLMGAKIGKGLPAFWFCCLSAFLSYLLF